MTKTTVDLAQRVLERLKIVAAGNTPTAEDQALVEDFYANTFQEMESDDVAFWDQEEIPERVFEALTDLIAGRIAPDFGMARPDLEASGDARLRLLAAEAPTGNIVTGSYF